VVDALGVMARARLGGRVATNGAPAFIAAERMASRADGGFGVAVAARMLALHRASSVFTSSLKQSACLRGVGVLDQCVVGVTSLGALNATWVASTTAPDDASAIGAEGSIGGAIFRFRYSPMLASMSGGISGGTPSPFRP
jgi:hypothetical protein